MNPTPPSCSMFFCLARNAPVGVILRRGPSRWVELILWRTEGDSFERGQWFHGRIYEERCDLSPDGGLFVYFAGKHTVRSQANAYRGTWSAVSRPPYLTALTLWPQGDTWGGGGVFTDPRTLYLSGYGAGRPHPQHPLGPLRVVEGSSNIWESVTAYSSYGRGWCEIQAGHRWARDGHGGQFKLVREFLSSCPDRFRHEIVHPESGTVVADLGEGWADWDYAGRLVYARAGKLFAARLPDLRRKKDRPKGHPAPLKETELADFTGDTPQRVAPPKWAMRW